jgi:hypothetical protein
LHLSFAEWAVLARVSREVRGAIAGRRVLREEVMERYLGMVGYRRWGWWEGNLEGETGVQGEVGYVEGIGKGREGEDVEPLVLTLEVRSLVHFVVTPCSFLLFSCLPCFRTS